MDLTATAIFTTFDPAMGRLERIDIDYAYKFDFLLRSLAGDDTTVGGNAWASQGKLLINGTEQFSGNGNGSGTGAVAGEVTPEFRDFWAVAGTSTLVVGGTAPAIWTDPFIGPMGGGGSVSIVYNAEILSDISIPPASVSVSLLPESYVTVTYYFGDFFLGDYNADGFVSQSDLDLVLLNWGKTSLPQGFDEAAVPGGAFDNLISQNELDSVLLNWGSGSPSNFPLIPEPGIGSLLGLGAVVLIRRRND